MTEPNTLTKDDFHTFVQVQCWKSKHYRWNELHFVDDAGLTHLSVTLVVLEQVSTQREHLEL